MNLDFNNVDKINDQIDGLEKIKGVCIYIEVYDYVRLKHKGMKKWLSQVNDTLRLYSGITSIIKDYKLRLVDDKIMIFIPDNGKDAIDYKGILEFVKEKTYYGDSTLKDQSYRTKACIHCCNDVSVINFAGESDHLFGKDIDIAARLLKKTRINRIILGESFYQLIVDNDVPFMKNTSDMLKEQFKEFTEKIPYRVMVLRETATTEE